ncbi:hypothetical protein M408DRAFT_10901 [Serendipita vermifera MAFF 305830]|uniref:Uncharacterized protein n=1 Tax=Serendipita vermifera MAFF 305830 TaxID=933852 RepID=A0A0C3AXA7_SERVB|nr:hypothetical protein M408DRAFT_10901 [Serendipita vermifera MAFF 305830]
MVSLETLEVYSTEHECIHPNTVPTGNVSFTVPRLKALRYQGQMHWVSEKLLSSVSQTVQHLEIKIVVQDLEYTRLPLVSAAIRFGILGQKDLDNRPANGILPVIPEEAWEAPASKYPTNITEATIAEAIIVDIMNSAHLTGIGHSPDYTMYAMPRNPEGALRFHWGEPIPILWRAPLDHSRKAWIGIYQDGANPHEVTTAKSEGRWVTLHAEEWDGDIPLPEHPIEESEMAECGEVAFRRFALPWETGQYEVSFSRLALPIIQTHYYHYSQLRYHRDGAYQMVSELRQVEIYLDRPKQIDPESLWKWLLRIVCLALDSDPDLVPRSALLTGDPTPPSHDLRMDDFRFWTNGNGKPTLRQAKRIAYAIEEALEIQLPADEIFGQPNVTILTRRILNLMSSPRSPTYPVDPTSLRSPFAPRKRRSRSTSQERMLSQNIFR